MTNTTPENHYRFLCDEMLRKLGHWLRAAGYDTAIADKGANDRALLERAVKEKRLFITRDRKLCEFRHAPGTVVLLHSNNMQNCARELQMRLSINWLMKPFSRCMLCNTPLTIAAPDCIDEVPTQSRASVKQLLYCNRCDKLYWEGSHVRRLRKLFNQWMDS
jgi:uncharacterized protein with PIN domain